jgi:hypothetical protein
MLLMRCVCATQGARCSCANLRARCGGFGAQLCTVGTRPRVPHHASAVHCRAPELPQHNALHNGRGVRSTAIGMAMCARQPGDGGASTVPVKACASCGSCTLWRKMCRLCHAGVAHDRHAPATHAATGEGRSRSAHSKPMPWMAARRCALPHHLLQRPLNAAQVLQTHTPVPVCRHAASTPPAAPPFAPRRHSV